MSDDEDDKENLVDKKSPPLTPIIDGDNLKRKRDVSDPQIKEEPIGSESPNKKLKSHSPPPPPPPPPAPPLETPTDSVHDSPTDFHAEQETRFKSKTMADVLASAQQDEEEDTSMVDVKTEDAPATLHLDGANSGITNGISCKQELEASNSFRPTELQGEKSVR